MLDQSLRLYTERIIKPIVVKTGLIKVKPNYVSLLGFFFGLGAAGFIAVQQTVLALLFWLVNRVLDGFDGVIARNRLDKVANDAGGYVDITLDFIVYAAIPLALGLANDDKQTWLAVSFLLASFYVNTITWTYLSALVEKHKTNDKRQKTSLAMPTGLIEGGETIVFFCLLIVFADQVNVLLYAMGIVVFASALLRFIQAYVQLLNQPATSTEESNEI